jgi:hypothetical protein
MKYVKIREQKAEHDVLNSAKTPSQHDFTFIITFFHMKINRSKCTFTFLLVEFCQNLKGGAGGSRKTSPHAPPVKTTLSHTRHKAVLLHNGGSWNASDRKRNLLTVTQQIRVIVILFHNSSTIKDESNQNVNFLSCSVLYSTGFPIKGKIIRSNTFWCVFVSGSTVRYTQKYQ